MEVPFLDLKAQYLSIKKEIDAAISGVFETTSFAGGKYVAQFEEEFASFCTTKYAIGCGSGTDALLLALRAFGIGKGDEVITVPNTFIATVEAIHLCGATAVFADVNELDFTMDPRVLESIITDNTKAIIPVHLYGQMAPMDPIMALASKYNLIVIEDACQAHGAEYRGNRAGSIGDAGCFSFYPGKNLGAYGEAGAVVSNDSYISEKIKVLRDHGQSKKYYHDVIGWNSRMDGLQGAVLSVKLQHLFEWNRSRINHAAYYNKALENIPDLSLPHCRTENKHIYHIYPLITQNRDAILNQLKAKKVYCGIHYPVPIHLQKAFSNNRAPGVYPNAEKCAQQELSLPMFPELSRNQMDYVIKSIRDLY